MKKEETSMFTFFIFSFQLTPIFTHEKVVFIYMGNVKWPLFKWNSAFKTNSFILDYPGCDICYFKQRPKSNLLFFLIKISGLLYHVAQTEFSAKIYYESNKDSDT